MVSMFVWVILKEIHIDHSLIKKFLWIEELNQLITLSLTELKVWLFENENFKCITSCKTGFKDEGSDADLQISADNQLIVATFRNNLFLFNLITKQKMLYQHEKEEKDIMRLGLTIPVIVSSSQIAFNNSNNIILYDVDFKRSRIKEKEVIALPYTDIGSFKFHSNGNDIIFVSHSNEDYLRIYHRDTKKLSNLCELGSCFMELTVSNDESLLKLCSKYTEDVYLRLVDLQYKKMRDEVLADSLPAFSLDVVGVVAKYCETNNTYRQPDARILTRLPFDLRLEFQLRLFSNEDPLLMLFFLIANSTKSLKQSVKDVETKYPSAARWWSSNAALFKKIKKASELKSPDAATLKKIR